MIAKIAVIGAGMAGLTVAKKLTKKGLSVDVFDKGRAVGGRMSSRRTEWGYLDHGVQYFTVKNPLFQNFIAQNEEFVKAWAGKFGRWQGTNVITIEPENPRYVPTIAMNNLCKKMATGLNVKLQTRIISLKKSQKWTLIDENEQLYSDYDFIIITAPPLQTIDLLGNHSFISESIRDLKMFACYSLMLIPENKLDLPFDGIEFQHPILGWICVNDSKPLRGEKGSIIIQSNFTWAEENLATTRDDIGEMLKNATSEVLKIKFYHHLYESVHLWRYAIPQQINDQGYYLDKSNNIGVCGDWCLNGEVESAFLSGYWLANKIYE
ncbi:FAD-dependent oxidoreductase [Geminocystis sp. GBBB08]|uniref:NAD(P)/FAD-dependent oxidoreductase n=1 Tax=Geminocystis sp. GBBB08 TaxID=2604140 RepID=UPI0027E393C4|nr:FAD-dependent oxidoreductase [Geminocystis sp. GBBB08]MBL1210508.1 FAD-dependent oxidoreductase [Geminocystis sp. GBBB08]